MPSLILDDVQLAALQQLGAIGWTDRAEMATVLECDPDELAEALSDPASEASHYFRKGEILGKFMIETKRFDLARTGDATAMREHEKHLRRRKNADED